MIRDRANATAAECANAASAERARDMEQIHKRALRRLDRRRRLFLATSIQTFARAMAEQHKLIVAFASKEPSTFLVVFAVAGPYLGPSVQL